MIIFPKKLIPYIDFEDEELIAVDLPDELQDEFYKFKRKYEELKSDKHTEY